MAKKFVATADTLDKIADLASRAAAALRRADKDTVELEPNNAESEVPVHDDQRANQEGKADALIVLLRQAVQGLKK